ncbi:class I SAM-dependent DNA methyltransferase [Agromyces sp. PvR057]|uniref:type I restriction-modification system subunit M n=1 Tax=Agromyces sp. PvR057 TaxID=3156403 RepID=UPI0033914007
MSSNNHAAFIWSVADLLRGSFKGHQYGDIILPFTVLRRLDCVLAPTKQAVLAASAEAKKQGLPVKPGLLKSKAGHALSFWNTSGFSLTTALGDPDQVEANLADYLNGFSANVQDIFEKYKVAQVLEDLQNADLLYLVAKRFTEVDLSPASVPNEEMGHIFEELIRKFSEGRERPGEHFTPRDVVELMVDLLLTPHAETLTKANVVRSAYDPTAGTGGLLSMAEDRIHHYNPTAKLHLAGQELQPESYAICKADMIMKGQRIDAIRFGDSLIDDHHAGSTFNYCLSNPPFGMDWKKQQKAVQTEHAQRGYAGRFGPGLPAVSDGAMLFLLHLISKMRDASDGEAGGRAAIVLNGSPLFTGGAGSGPSNIRKWILERDLLEAIVALPTDMFYNTGIATYVWVLSNDKAPERKGKVQLVDGSKLAHRLKKSLGSKRNFLNDDDIAALVTAYGEFEETEKSKIFHNEDFFYRTITVERPLRQVWRPSADAFANAVKPSVQKKFEGSAGELDQILALLAGSWADASESLFLVRLRDAADQLNIELPDAAAKLIAKAFAISDPDGTLATDAKGKPLADPSLRDTENVPWAEDVHAYFAREVTPFAADAWIDESKTKEGCEIPFTRHFYVYTPPRPLEDIDRDLDVVLGRIRARLEAVRA